MPSLPILPSSLPIPNFSNRSLSSCKTFNGSNLFLPFSTPSSSFTIRMGGGPRTFPGGVTKWQWKRMQAKRSKQLLKARLCRERQLYEMRKRAELKAAISELERPWEAVERAPVLFSVSVDEQIKALADRFQRPSGFDMWSERDGPRLFTKAYGSNRESCCEEIEMNGDDMARQKRREMSENAETRDSRLERQKRPGGVGSRVRNSDSYRFQSDFGFDQGSSESYSRMQRQEMSGGFDRRRGRSSRGSHSELQKEENEGEISNSSRYRNASAGAFDRRGGNRGSNRSYSELALTDSRSRFRNASADGFDRRSVNRGSNRSNSELALTDSRSGLRNLSAGGFDRRSVNRGSNRLNSELALTDSRSRFRNASTGSSVNRGSNRSYSELALADSRSGFRNLSAGGFDRRGGSVNRNSYGSESEIENGGFRRGGIRNNGFSSRGTGRS